MLIKWADDRYETLTAVDRMTNKVLGTIAFSRKDNAITSLSVSPEANYARTTERLTLTARRQLDTDGENRGHSFHYRYPEFIQGSVAEGCHVCNGQPSPPGQDEIIPHDSCYIMAEYPGQGRLFGKMYVMPKVHAFHFEDMPESDMAAFMAAVQRVGRTLRKVTGAEKINYEMHGNTGPHLHIHLFPRYLDDDFPGAPIDCRVTVPPYKSYEEYLWFIDRMREELKEELL